MLGRSKGLRGTQDGWAPWSPARPAVAPSGTPACISEHAMEPTDRNTSLDREELNEPTTTSTAVLRPPTLDPAHPLQAIRHRRWSYHRRQIYEALVKADVPYRQLEAFATCGAGAMVLRHRRERSRYKFTLVTCKHRLCQPCAADRARTIRQNIAAYAPGRSLRFVTLTLRRSDDPLPETVTRIWRAFKALRRKPCWKATQRGGIAVLELKARPDGGPWHVHLHVLAEGRFISQPVLAREWLAVTGDSRIVDIRLVRQLDQATRYVTQYVTKPFGGPRPTTADHLVDAVGALARRKTILTYGTWRRQVILTTKSDPDYEPVDHACAILLSPHIDDRHRQALHRAWQRAAAARGPLELTITDTATDDAHAQPP